MDLKDELSSEHQRHIEDMSTRANQDAETQLAQLRFKYEDEIEQLKKLHGKELEQKLRDQQNTLERKHKGETNKLVLKYQEQIGLLKTRAGTDIGEYGSTCRSRGEFGPPPPHTHPHLRPWKITKAIGILMNTDLDPRVKSQNYTASIQCWAIIGPSAKRHLNSV